MIAELTIDVVSKGSSYVVPTTQELFTRYPFVAVLLGLMILDIITGLLAAFVSKELCSTTSYRGMVGKVQIVGMVAMAMLMEIVIPNVAWGQFISIFFIVTEAISITENAHNSGVPLPLQLVEALRKARGRVYEKQADGQINIVVGNDDIAKEVAKTRHDIKDDLNTVSLKVTEVQEALKSHDSGVLKSTELTSPPRKEA